MRVNVIQEAIPERITTIQIKNGKEQEAIEHIIKNFDRIACCDIVQTYDWGIEGFINEKNGKPIRKIVFYVRES